MPMPVMARHVEHDPRSRAFPAATAPIRTVHHQHHGPTLDQGQIGACTGNASADALMSGPLYRPGRDLAEPAALRIYELATTLDNQPGQYPPDDTGSTGLAAAKACKELGYISSYRHAFGAPHAIGALQHAPIIIGIPWYEGFDEPAKVTGLVHARGRVRGGHEVCVLGYDASDGELELINSWGDTWGVAIPGCGVEAGGFRMSRSTFAKVLADQGDATVFVP